MIIGKFGDSVGANLLCGRRHVAQHHVIEHALPERGDLFGYQLLLPKALGLSSFEERSDSTVASAEAQPMSQR